jgi:hypothetical protein
MAMTSLRRKKEVGKIKVKKKRFFKKNNVHYSNLQIVAVV